MEEEKKYIQPILKKRYRLTFIMFGIDCILVLLGVIYASEIIAHLSHLESPLVSKENLYIVLALYLLFSTFLAHKTYTNIKKNIKTI